MTIPVDLGELEAAARERGPAAYILTVNDRGTPHVVHAEVTITSEGLVVQVGERTALHARHRPNVSLLYPCRSAADYSLIVDAVASVVATPGGSRLLLMPTRAVLHRPAPVPETALSSCGADCVPLSLGAKR